RPRPRCADRPGAARPSLRAAGPGPRGLSRDLPGLARRSPALGLIGRAALAGEPGHRGEARHDALARTGAGELAIERVDVDDNPLALAPLGEVAQRDVLGGLERAHARVVALAGLGLHVLQILAQASNASLVGERAVAGHDR